MRNVLQYNRSTINVSTLRVVFFQKKKKTLRVVYHLRVKLYLTCQLYTLNYENLTKNGLLEMMMPFFNRNWAGAYGGSLGWTWTADGLGCRLLVRLGRGPPLEKQERRGVGGGFARGRSDA